jgi:hypothetical protein
MPFFQKRKQIYTLSAPITPPLSRPLLLALNLEKLA